MELDNDRGSADTFAPASAPAPMPMPTPVAVPKADHFGDKMPKMSEKESPNVASFLLWLTAIVSVVATIMLGFFNASAAQNLIDKEAEKSAALSELTSPANVALDAKAVAFKTAVEKLRLAEKTRYDMAQFLPLLYGRVNTNVVVKNLSVDAAGKVSFDGTTDSYKSAAEQLVSLQEWKINSKQVVKDAHLVSQSEDISKGVVVTFAIEGTIDKTVSLTTTATTSTKPTTGGL